MSNRPSDETLMAYADGALADRQRADVEAYLANDAEAQRFVEALRRSSALATAAFGQPMQEPVPQHLIDAIMTAPAAPLPATFSRASRTSSAGRDRFARWALPMAASLALLAGSSIGYVIGNKSASPSTETALVALGQVAPASHLARLLETTPSGLPIDAASGGRRLTVVATFRDRQARICREVEVLAPGKATLPMTAGIACRAVDGRWIVEGAISLAVVEGSDRYLPSGAAEKDALEGLVNLLGAGSALSPDEEKTLIDRGWKTRE